MSIDANKILELANKSEYIHQAGQFKGKYRVNKIAKELEMKIQLDLICIQNQNKLKKTDLKEIIEKWN